MQCFEIMAALETLAPLHLALEWDNSGLLVGRRDKEVNRIYLALDVTETVIKEAIDFQADMIICHHPLLFQPLKKVTDEDFQGRRVYDLIRHDICCYVMHTNFDIAPGCMADMAAGLISLEAEEPLEITGELAGEAIGIGRIGSLDEACTLQALAQRVKVSMAFSGVTVYGNLTSDKPVQRIAISPGSGKSMIRHALAKQAEVLITGDIDHHTGLDALADGLAIIDGGHYGTEYMFIPYLREHLESHFGNQLQIEYARFEAPNQMI